MTGVSSMPGVFSCDNADEALRDLEMGEDTWFRFRVVGFWSDVISVYVRSRGLRIEMSHSSGGRDAKVEPDDLVAEHNMGTAMRAIAEFFGDLRDNRGQEFLAARDARDQLRKQQAEQEAARRAEAIASRPAMGDSVADRIITDAKLRASRSVGVSKLCEGRADVVIRALSRLTGEPEFEILVTRSRGRGRVLLSMQHPLSFEPTRVVSFTEAVSRLGAAYLAEVVG